MQLFIASLRPERISKIEEITQSRFEDSVSLAAFPQSGQSQSFAIASQLESSSLVVVDCLAETLNFSKVAWILGVCFVVGTPVVGLAGRHNPNPEKAFTPLQDVVTIVSSLDDLQAVVLTLGSAFFEGMEAYAEVATELHTKFVGK